MKFEATLFICNKPNYNNRIYPEAVIEEALKFLEDKDFLCTTKTSFNGNVDLSKTSHKLISTNHEDHLGEIRYTGIFKILDTPLGNTSINHSGDSDSTGSLAAQLWTAYNELPEKYQSWIKRLDIVDAFTFITSDKYPSTSTI